METNTVSFSKIEYANENIDSSLGRIASALANTHENDEEFQELYELYWELLQAWGRFNDHIFKLKYR
jgi:hypothetical protein